jgi:pyrophosphatase PpaX
VRYSTVLFDLDGTLIDSGEMILASMRHATRTVLAREIPDDKLLAYVGSSTLDDQMRALDPDRVEELVATYREHNGPLHDELQPCAGVMDIVEQLDAEGRKLGIVTAKRRATVALAFDVLPLEHLFDVVVATDEVARAKPHPDGILRALELLDSTPQEAVYVGDAPFDIQSAKAAGAGSIAVTWGRIHDRERLAAEEPDAIVDTPEELLAAL